MKLNYFQLLPESKVNGPGNRSVLWVQGCDKQCPGCFNKASQSAVLKTIEDPRDVADRIIRMKDSIEGITFSGGEPFLQAEALNYIAAAAKFNELSVMVFTGYTMAELLLMHDRHVEELIKMTDILVAGPYQEKIPSNHPWCGSGNQRVHFLTKRYRHLKSELYGKPLQIEVRINEEGVITTGFPVNVGD